MIDLKYVQNHFEEAARRLRSKGVPEETLAELARRFEALKEANRAFESARAEQKRLSQEYGAYRREGKDAGELKERLDRLKGEVSTLQEAAREAQERLQELALGIPNLPDPDVPQGEGEEDNVEIRRVGEPPRFDFTPREHWELAEINGWIDFERGVKLAKSRFSVLHDTGARLHRALINYFLDKNRAKGFVEYDIPYLNNSRMLLGTGQLPKFEEDLFKVCDEDLWLIPTAEVPLTNLYNDEILSAEELPVLMTAYSPCFRREAGSAGRDTRGMIRQHQFTKVEMVAIAHPDKSDEVFEMMVENASEILSELGLPHRLVELCTGDLGFSAARTVDLEVWLPGQNRYREISSVSNTRDFQARRAKIRFKEGKSNRLVHTLNGSALAVGRTLVAIMENYQRADGSVAIPEALKPYMPELSL
ncbi:serine--tRNA ligase [Nitratifractor sp.]